MGEGQQAVADDIAKRLLDFIRATPQACVNHIPELQRLAVEAMAASNSAKRVVLRLFAQQAGQKEGGVRASGVVWINGRFVRLRAGRCWPVCGCLQDSLQTRVEVREWGD